VKKYANIRSKVQNSASRGFYQSEKAFYKGYITVLKGSKKLHDTTIETCKKVAGGSRKLANTVTQRGKIDERVLDSITIQSINSDIEGWIQSEFESKKGEIIKQSSKNLYKQWLRWLNEYVLLNVFGHLIAFDQAKFIIENRSSYSEQERKLNLLAFLFVEIQALRKRIEYTNTTLPMYLNREDDDWLLNNIFLISQKPRQNSQSLGRSLTHLNNTFTTLLRNISDIERSISSIGNVIKVQSTGTGEILSEIITDPKNLNPWFLLNNSENLVANIIPGLFTGRAKKRALDEYATCENKCIFLNSIIPPLIVETQRSNLSSISLIIDRDFNYIGKQNQENPEIKKALFKRILKFEAIKRFTNIEKKNTLCISYGDVIKKIVSISSDCLNKNAQL
jgi:hypothetical protein